MMIMKFFKQYTTVLAVSLLSIQFGCKDSGTEPIAAQLEFLGFEDKFALRMVLSEPYLYVCAGSDGVWKMNIRQTDSDWKYLGLRDTSLGKYGNVGALDIDVLGEDILVAYNGSAPHIPADSTISVWRSTNGGQSWDRSDRGIPESIPDPYEQNTLTSLQRSPHQPNIVMGLIDPTTYRSLDGGNSWAMNSGVRGVFSGDGDVRWHPFKAGEVWFFGSAALFYPYCFGMQNYGIVAKASVNFDSLGFPPDGAVNDIAFDAGNPDIIYAATSQGIIKSYDGGYTWRTGMIRLPDNGFVTRLANHPIVGGTIYMGGGKSIYRSTNAGKNVNKIGEVESGFIQSLAFDNQGNQLFIGTTEGIYALIL